MTWAVDADDFCETNHRLELLTSLFSANPKFRITLFAIPQLCPKRFRDIVQGFSFIDLVPHGWEHPHPREMEDWTYDRSQWYLDHVEHLGWTRGFKAPGWQISDGMYRALLERDYWVADQHYNDGRRPDGLRVVFPDDDGALHFHIGHLGGHNDNEIGYFEDQLLNLEGRFVFLKDRVAAAGRA